MKHLIKGHYKLIKARGLIVPETTLDQFMNKMEEEYYEVMNAYADDMVDRKTPSPDLIYEMTDLVMVVMNCFQHYGVDFKEQLLKNVAVQKQRVIHIDS